MKTFRHYLGKVTFKIRTRKGITLPELSRRTGIRELTIMQMESGEKEMDNSKLSKIADALEEKGQDLLDEAEALFEYYEELKS